MNANETTTFSTLAPLAAPLPSPPTGELFTLSQWATLLALCEPFIPAIPSNPHDAKYAETVEELKAYLPEGAGEEVIEEFLGESAVTLPEFRETLHRSFEKFVPRKGRDGLGVVLGVLDSKAGAFLMTGYATPFSQQPLEIRCQIIAGWANSYLPLLRSLHRTFAGLTKKVWASHSTALPKMLDFPSVPKNMERGDSHDFKFHDFTSADASTTISTDVVIVGSGCGAGVMASTLSRAGLKCLVLEKSYHFSASYFPMSGASSSNYLFEAGGAVPSDDSSIAVVAGSTWGGGGTVNWSASLQPQSHVRHEWAQSDGLPQFSTAEFQSCLDYVCGRMGVAKSNVPEELANIPQNFANSTLLEGARRLGLSSMIVPQNSGGKPHWCGYCSSGCPSCTKQGPANNWLPDAAAHGAEFIEGCFVDKIVFSSTDQSTATGVACTWTSRDSKTTKSLTINAPRVVVSGGTLNSPLVLMRSGLINPQIGKNLHLHPVACILARWADRVNPWEGPILSSAVTALQNYDGTSHGPAIECLCAVPSFATMFFPYRANLITKDDPFGAAREMKVQMAKLGYSMAFISLQRDRDTGEVYPDPDNNKLVRIKYTASQRDRNGIVAGQVAAARICYVMGAAEIDCALPQIPRFVRSKTASTEVNDEAFELWLKDVSTTGIGSKNWEMAPLGSAHQMGTCRISTTAEKGVVDVKGKVWGYKNVWVADASVFPSATGVNPMVTTMGLAEWIARGVAREWKERSGKE